MSFSSQLDKFIRKTEEKLIKAYQEACNSISKEVAFMTGVDTGRLLANYQPGVNTPISYPGIECGVSSWKNGVKDLSIAEKNRSKALNYVLPRIDKITSKLKLGDVYWFVTSESYAPYVEYIGWKKTPPYRMFARARMDWELIVNNKARELSNV